MANRSNAAPKISVVIPVHNGASFLDRCLTALFASDFDGFEVIVVDDHSTDESVAIARRYPCTVMESATNAGPAAARNRGAKSAVAPILFFLDADILVARDSLRSIAARFSADPQLAALFGSYGADTVPENFCSRYKNLLHHYTHQHSREEASTFCSGFGAIRRAAFNQLGGFDPSCRFLEDIELGYRMRRHAMRVRLCKDLQFTHCKRYSFFGLVRSDVLGRAVPWTRLMLERNIFRNDLNTQWHNVLSVPLSYLLLAVLFTPMAVLGGLVLAAALVALNGQFLWLAYRQGGPVFFAGSIAMCWFGCLYSGFGLAAGVSAHYLRGPRSQARPLPDLNEL